MRAEGADRGTEETSWAVVNAIAAEQRSGVDQARIVPKPCEPRAESGHGGNGPERAVSEGAACRLGYSSPSAGPARLGSGDRRGDRCSHRLADSVGLCDEPELWSWQNPVSIAAFLGGWALAGAGVALVASVGAAAALVLYTASGGWKHRASIGGFGAGAVLLLAGWGFDQLFSPYSFAIYAAVPGSVIAASIAAVRVSRAVKVESDQAS